MDSRTLALPTGTPKKARRVRPSSLAIIERGYRGALEEQYGNIVWLSECMRAMRADHNVLLCGPAVACAFADQRRQDLTLAGTTVTTLSHFPDAVSGLLDKGARVWVLANDLKQYQGSPALVPCVEVAPDMITLIDAHDKIWFW